MTGFETSDEDREEQIAFIRNDLTKAKNIEDLEERISRQSEKNQLFLQEMLKEINQDLEERTAERKTQNEIEERNKESAIQNLINEKNRLANKKRSLKEKIKSLFKCH